jgi:4-alpha-glucanotransferase
VGTESACVWSRQHEFLQQVSLGAPPDDFSADGQDWGLPAYNWPAMDRGNLQWLRSRAEHAARLYDRFRIDHVVGFFRMWIKDHGAPRGHFSPDLQAEQDARGRHVLGALKASAGPAQIIAEDLGVIPPFVRHGLAELGLPGYKVLPWERGDDNRLRDPSHFPTASVATYSTHDTAPITQWWDDFKPWEKAELGAMAGFDASREGTFEREHKLIDLLLRSGSELALLLVTELIGDRARINLPGTVGPHNWTYRLPRGIDELARDQGLSMRFARIKSSVQSAHRA